MFPGERDAYIQAHIYTALYVHLNVHIKPEKIK